MKTFWVATIALLIGMMTSNAWGQTTPTEEQPLPVVECPRPELQSLPVIERPGRENNTRNEISELKLCLVPEVTHDHSWPGFHWGILVSGRSPFFTGDASYAIPMNIDGLLRLVFPNHLGLEIVGGLGVWATRGINKDTVTTMAGSFGVNGVIALEYGGFLAGLQYYVLQHPVAGEDDPLSVVLIQAGAEICLGNGFTARLTLGIPVLSSYKRTSGEFWGGLSFGYISR